jgi:biotin transport system substrate-specific component
MKKSALFLAQISLMSCFLAICAQISIPIGGIPMTLQTFAIALCGYLLGIKRGLTTVLLYLSLGAVGIPVFAGFGASFAFLFGLTGGFLWGFFPFMFFCGFTLHIKRNILKILISCFGLLLCHLFGVIWFSLYSGNSFFASFFISSFPYLLKDMISIWLAQILADKVRHRLPKMSIF